MFYFQNVQDSSVENSHKLIGFSVLQLITVINAFNKPNKWQRTPSEMKSEWQFCL
jgi:hypothetical protein